MPLSRRQLSLQALFAIICCPACRQHDENWCLSVADPAPGREVPLTCSHCHEVYSWKDGILDFIGKAEASQSITPFQRVMQFSPVAAIYKKYWRPLGFFIASSSSFRHFCAKVMELMNPGGQQLILDLACGPGLFTCPMAQSSSGWVIGFDLSLPMLRRARKMANALGLTNVLLVRGSAFRLPFLSGAFDATLCSGALHLFDRPDDAIAEIARTLRVHGCFVCQTTIKPKHSAGVAAFLDRVIRFGFFRSPKELNEKLRPTGIIVNEVWQRRIIYLFRSHRL